MDWLKDFVETAGSIYLQGEQIKAQQGDGNLPSDHPRVTTGVDSNGDPIVGRQLVSGVSNATLLAGVAGVLLVGGMTAALVFSD